MKTTPIVPARVEFRDDGVPFAPVFGDVYHAKAGAFAQAREVFLAGNGLPQRWRGRERFVVLETGFGLGNNFLATWAAWRADAERSQRLVFASIEKHPLTAADMARAHASSPEPALAEALVAAWPPPVHGLHTLEFDEGAVTLLLALGDVTDWMPELQLSADAIYLDGFAPARNAEMWDARTLRALGRLGAPGATAATWSAARAVHEALAGAGFRARHVPGFAGKREMTVAESDADAAERRLSAPPGRRTMPDARTALVIGAGLAGASAAHALARQGLKVRVLEAGSAPAEAASGNPAGLFHGVAHPEDGVHAQLLRAAALRAAQVYRPLIESRRVPGAMRGLLRGASNTGLGEMRALAEQQALPPAYAEPLTREQASALAACELAGPAWYYPGGGWLQPAALVREWLREPGVTLHINAPVAALQCDDDGRWSALDSSGRSLATADLVVLAAANETPALLAAHSEAAAWPWRRTRGQLTLVPPAAAASLPRPALPLASGGYLISLPEELGGGLLCGATAQSNDEEASLRLMDHRANLENIAALTDAPLPEGWFEQHSSQLSGRVAWRFAVDDRLPIVGPVPLAAASLQGARRLEQPRHVPRVSGLYVLAALGSRGITWAPLLGELLAAAIVGAPLPLPGSLLDAVDPARFAARALRRSAP